MNPINFENFPKISQMFSLTRTAFLKHWLNYIQVSLWYIAFLGLFRIGYTLFYLCEEYRMEIDLEWNYLFKFNLNLQFKDETLSVD